MYITGLITYMQVLTVRNMNSHVYICRIHVCVYAHKYNLHVNTLIRFQHHHVLQVTLFSRTFL